MTISKFKACCSNVLAGITRRGIPIAARVLSDTEWMGSMRDSIEIHGDIVGAVGAFEGWG